MLRWIGFFAGAASSLLRPELSADADDQRLAESSRQPLELTRELSPLARILDLNFRSYLLDDLLFKANRCSMAHASRFARRFSTLR
jgi:hypothetical protein